MTSDVTARPRGDHQPARAAPVHPGRACGTTGHDQREDLVSTICALRDSIAAHLERGSGLPGEHDGAVRAGRPKRNNERGRRTIRGPHSTERGFTRYGGDDVRPKLGPERGWRRGVTSAHDGRGK